MSAFIDKPRLMLFAENSNATIRPYVHLKIILKVLTFALEKYLTLSSY
jgi:hypothetical protein